LFRSLTLVDEDLPVGPIASPLVPSTSPNRLVKH